MFWTAVESPIDSLLLVGDETGLRELQMEPHEPPAEAVRDDDALAPVAAQLRDYFAGARTRFELPLSPHGTRVPAEGVAGAARDPVRRAPRRTGRSRPTSASRPRPGRSAWPTAATRSR